MEYRRTAVIKLDTPESADAHLRETVDADRTVLVNVSEHKARQHTAALDRLAADDGCELGDDLTQYSV